MDSRSGGRVARLDTAPRCEKTKLFGEIAVSRRFIEIDRHAAAPDLLAIGFTMP
jgi:hypothetical protein